VRRNSAQHDTLLRRLVDSTHIEDDELRKLVEARVRAIGEHLATALSVAPTEKVS